MRVARLAAVAFMLVITITACGGGGGGGSSSDTTSGPSSKDVIGNLKFVYDIISEYTDRYTIDGKTKSDNKTSDDTEIYMGYNADYPSLGLEVAAAWYPSLSKYLAVAETALSDTYYNYTFTITDTGGLRGCFSMSISGTFSDCYDLKDVSQRFPLDVWARTDFSGREWNDRLSEIRELEEARMTGATRSISNLDEFMELKAALEERN